jgi:elongation factor G
VDDERLIIRGLSTVVPWAELGCEVAGTAHDGISGLELIRSIHPDIVLTDIRMPNMDGLTMLAAIRSEFPDIQMSVLTSKLKNLYNVETELLPARVAYREKIRGKVEAHGRHKKQTGGSGQFGDVWIRFEPQEESDDLVFAEEVFGGSVPKNFFPSVEKGLRNAVQKGVLAGYPLVGLKATLYDGSYHPVDSNDMAFQTAARLAYQDGIPKAKPTILEPIGLLQVSIPDENLGDIMSDISSKRRGTVLGMTAEDGMQTVEAEVPMAEMSSYTIDLRSMTQGRGSFTCKFIRYEEAPGNVQQKVIEEAKALAEAE